ncbi:hypothetical protein [Vibrio sp. 10N.261.46.A3]|uniref:VirB4 family type IV secretion/conjugal transfer ATPase n=1 Tax=Vibrio sp. 10N.261.46.A3 TaxID=3229658 RepID=UPI00354DCA2E
MFQSILPSLRKPHIFQLYEQAKNVHHVASTFPLLKRVDDCTAITKNGALVRVYGMNGQDYTGLKEDHRAHLSRVRSQLFEMAKTRVSMTIHSSKHLTKHQPKKVKSNAIHDQIFQAWEEGFTDVYRTEHHIVVTVNPPNKAQKAVAKIENALRQTSEQILNEFESSLLSKLEEFSCYRLEGADMSSFFSTLLNGRYSYVDAIHWDNTLLGHYLGFDRKLNYCEYGRDDETIYASYLSIQGYPDQLDDTVLRKIYSLDIDVTITQSFTPMTDESTNRVIEHQDRMARNSRSEQAAETAWELKQELEAENMTLCKHFFCIEVRAKSVDDLNQKTQRVIKAVENKGIKIIRESVGIEPLFWSRFPTLEYLNVRGRQITNHNAGDLTTFERIGEGFEINSFGNRPVTHFPTTTNSLYSFNFHNTPKPSREALGHTVIYGASESGKTTLISFLVSSCLGYKDFKTILFDKDHGLEIMTKLYEGDYLNFAEKVDINPLQLPDSESNRRFLARFIRHLTGIAESQTELNAKVESAVRSIMELDVGSRTFTKLSQGGFGKDGGEAMKRLEKWLPNGANGSLFNAPRDAFNFDKQIVTFDATTIIHDPEMLGALTNYIFHKYVDYISERDIPSLLFFDESPAYLRDVHFRQHIGDMLMQIRKKRGSVILAAQSPKHHVEAPDGVGDTIKTNVANIICYPNRSAEREHYMDFLGLTESEYKWVVETTEKYLILFKRRDTGESVILNVNLSRLDNGEMNYLNAFKSGNSPRLHLKYLKDTYAQGWQERYLQIDTFGDLDDFIRRDQENG